jgi:hypothetical protein
MSTTVEQNAACLYCTSRTEHLKQNKIGDITTCHESRPIIDSTCDITSKEYVHRLHLYSRSLVSYWTIIIIIIIVVMF